MWLRDARMICEWLCRRVSWKDIPGTAARDYARFLTGIEKTLEKNPLYLQGKQDRLAGLPATSKEKSYRMAYWNGFYGNQELPEAVDGCDWTEERAAHDQRLLEKFRKRWGHLSTEGLGKPTTDE